MMTTITGSESGVETLLDRGCDMDIQGCEAQTQQIESLEDLTVARQVSAMRREHGIDIGRNIWT